MRPSREVACMAMANVMAQRGTCSRKQVGVVIAKEGRILSTGYNSAPAGMSHCNHECDCNYRLLKLPYQDGNDHNSECKAHPAKVCNVVVHAEINAIVWAAKHGIATDGADLYTTYSSCLNCAKAVINAGIERYYYTEEYHDRTGLQLVFEAGIEIFDMSSVEMIG